MEVNKRKSISEDIKKFIPYSDSEGFIEVTEWANGEGWDIVIDEKVFSLHRDELNAIETLTRVLDYKLYEE